MQDRILIVGAGITGAALAHRLTSLGVQVTVVEGIAPAAMATGRSFGWINASFHLSPDHYRLRLAAMAAHRALALELDLQPTTTCCLWFEEAGAGFDRLHDDLTALGYPCHPLTRAEVALLEPALPNPPERALFFPSESALDPAALTKALLNAASAKGATVLSGLPVSALLTTGDAVTGITTPAGPILADHTILATGTGTPALLAPLGLTFPMLHRPGAIFRSQPLPPMLTHILVTPRLEVRQDAQGRILCPTAAAHQADASTTLPPPEALLQDTLNQLKTLLPQADIRPDELRMAERPVPGDGLPAIGPVRPGLSMAVMHSGATLAPEAANLLAAELTGQGDQTALAPFRPARFWG
jgi:glycine/D-amino acid oxidase-like deaminating enzyme